MILFVQIQRENNDKGCSYIYEVLEQKNMNVVRYLTCLTSVIRAPQSWGGRSILIQLMEHTDGFALNKRA